MPSMGSLIVKFHQKLKMTKFESGHWFWYNVWFYIIYNLPFKDFVFIFIFLYHFTTRRGSKTGWLIIQHTLCWTTGLLCLMPIQKTTWEILCAYLRKSFSLTCGSFQKCLSVLLKLSLIKVLHLCPFSTGAFKARFTLALHDFMLFPLFRIYETRPFFGPTLSKF